jgi:hypothetical protein
MQSPDPRADEIWKQTRLPVVLRGSSIAPLLVKLPYRIDNYAWLQNGRRTKPKWLDDRKAWSIPKSWFEDTLRRSLVRHGAVWVLQPVNEMEKCAPACWKAVGALCECSCLGLNHGSASEDGKWHVVSDTFAVRVKDRRLSCRLLKPV